MNYPDIDPVIFQLGPLAVHWYGLMYLIGFFGFFWLAKRRIQAGWGNWRVDQLDDLIFYGALGVILGGRVGYVLFYQFSAWLENPLYVFYIHEGGMSFHGGLLGVLAGMALFARKYAQSFWTTTDFIAPMVPIGLGAGRVGNFINNELWGKPTDLPWGIIPPCPVDQICAGLPVHPSQLYEALSEGLLLFILLWVFSQKPRPRMAISGLFLLGYGLFRFLVEFVRVPDAHLNYLALNWVTMGQLLSLPMVGFGGLLLWLAYRSPQSRRRCDRAE